MKNNHSNKLYPINFNRNVALSQAETELIIVLDIDMIPYGDIQSYYNDTTNYNILLKYCNDKNLCIIPAFEGSVFIIIVYSSLTVCYSKYLKLILL